MSEKRNKEQAQIRQGQPVKVVAAMPGQDLTPEEIQEMKAHDGYPVSCGIPAQPKEE